MKTSDKIKTTETFNVEDFILAYSAYCYCKHHPVFHVVRKPYPDSMYSSISGCTKCGCTEFQEATPMQVSEWIEELYKPHD